MWSKDEENLANNISFDENHFEWMKVDSSRRDWCKTEKKWRRHNINIESKDVELYRFMAESLEFDCRSFKVAFKLFIQFQNRFQIMIEYRSFILTRQAMGCSCSIFRFGVDDWLAWLFSIDADHVTKLQSFGYDRIE